MEWRAEEVVTRGTQEALRPVASQPARGLTGAEAARRLYGIMVEIVYRADFETLARRWSLGGLAAVLERTR